MNRPEHCYFQPGIFQSEPPQGAEEDKEK